MVSFIFLRLSALAAALTVSKASLLRDGASRQLGQDVASVSEVMTFTGGYHVATDGLEFVRGSTNFGRLAAAKPDVFESIITRSYSGWDNFGAAVAISGDYVIGGAMFDTTRGISGSAYVFQKALTDSGSTVEYTQVQKLSETDVERFYGSSVAASGDHLLVGAAQNWEAGAVYFYKLNSSGLYERIQMEEVAGGGKFGAAMAVDGGLAVIAAPKNDKAFVYAYDDASSTWSQSQVLICKDCADYEVFGESVALKDGVLVVGSKAYSSWSNLGATSGYEGRAMVYHVGTDGQFSLTQTLVGPSTFSWFGESVAVYGTKVYVGASGVDSSTGLSDVGLVYEYQQTEEEYTLTRTLQSSNPEKRDKLGSSLAVSDDGSIYAGGSGIGAYGGSVLMFV